MLSGQTQQAGKRTGRDTLDTTTTSETSDGGLGDTLDVVAKNLSVALGTALAKTLSALAAWRNKLTIRFVSGFVAVLSTADKTRRRG
jgi:tRNA A37 threonylcarbamoyltransferase TsaD